MHVDPNLINNKLSFVKFFFFIVFFVFFVGGSSCDQDSMLYRCGDTDSGLGRATPPRRAASPSGPGSLPIRRKFDDGASDTGSDYCGPR